MPQQVYFPQIPSRGGDWWSVWQNLLYLANLLNTGAVGGGGVVIPPVVNGQWIKGVGGAAVWQPIAQSDLPPPLQASETAPSGNDLNNATACGWYQITSAMTNSPVVPGTGAGVNGHMQVFNDGANSLKQVIYQRGTYATWSRYNNAGAGWTAWQTQPVV